MGNTQKKRVAGAALIVMSALALSRVTGFLRSTFIPNLIADKHQTDAFFMSFRITDFMYNLLLGGAISAALIPVLTGYIAKKEEEDGWKAVGTFINVTFIGMTIISLLGIIFSPQIVNFMAPRFDAQTKALTVTCTRILFPSVAFIMLAGLMNGVLNSYQRFAAAAYGPSLYNVGSAISILLLGRYGVEKVVTGIMCSAAVYFLFQLSFAFRNLKYYRFRIHIKHSGFIRLYKLAIPSFLSSAIYQINVLVSSYFTALLTAGSVSAYTMANDVWQMPFGIFAVGIGTALLPSLSEKLALKDVDGYKNLLVKGLKSVSFFTIPSAVGIVALNKPIINAIYKWTDGIDRVLLSETGKILLFFSIAVISHSMLAIINRAFYASNDTKTPLYVGVGTIFLTAVLNYTFINMTNLHAAGMSLSYSIASILNVVILTSILNKRMKGLGLDKVFTFMGKIAFAAIIMGVVLFLINNALPVQYTGKISTYGKSKELLILFGEVTLGVLTYFTMVTVMRIEEATYTLNKIKGKVHSFYKKLFGRDR
ncbi:MAG: murein biosynthesis integral membrane protein MurJ [Clostridia bacterium]|nr:murein biosynthesis integral membrane protein MurJ [Clostridia bacterium]